MLRSDAFGDARAMLEDAPEEAFGSLDRWGIVAVLMMARKEVEEELADARREIGRGRA